MGKVGEVLTEHFIHITRGSDLESAGRFAEFSSASQFKGRNNGNSPCFANAFNFHEVGNAETPELIEVIGRSAEYFTGQFHGGLIFYT